MAPGNDIGARAARWREGRVTVAVVGLGYVGLPLALAMAEAGISVVGHDLDAAIVAATNAGRSHLVHLAHAPVAAARAAGRLAASTDPACLREAEAILLCVPTPLDEAGAPDLAAVRASARAAAAYAAPGALVVLESTTWPGTTDEIVRPILEAAGHRVGTTLFLAYSPEREDPGNARYGTRAIPKLVGADDSASRALAEALYGAFVETVVPVASTRVAEGAKLLENTFRAVNIALANEMKTALAAMGVDPWAAVAAAATKPFGFMAFEPGPGPGGHCVPVDPAYLTHRAAAFGAPTPLVSLASRLNREAPLAVAEATARALRPDAPGDLRGLTVLVLGVAYKRGVGDVRESAALAILRDLAARDARVGFHDPHVPAIPPVPEAGELAGLRSTPLDAAAIAAADAIVVATDHDAIDWPLVTTARLIVDARDALAKRGLSAGRVVKA